MVRRRPLFLVLVLVLSSAALAGAQATPYVQNLDPAYEDLDALVAAGWVHDATAAQRPYSRLTVARFIVEARRRAAQSPAPPARFTEALNRLERAFAPELNAACMDRAITCGTPPARPTLRSASSDAVWTNSPGRPVPTSYGPAGASYIEATLNPLVQNNEGRVAVNGATAGAEVAVDATMGSYFAAAFHPRVWVDEPQGADVGAGATVQEGYVRALVGDVAFDIGRNHIADGYARNGGPILSDNPRGLDQLRLSLDHADVMPSFLGIVGPVNASALIASMGGNSDTPHSKLVVFTGDIHPHPDVALGATILNHFGGEGLPPVSFGKRLEDLFLIMPQSGVESDKVIGASARVTVPSVKSQFYVDMMTTDDHHLFKYANEALGPEAVWTGGAKTVGLGAGGRTDLWIEGSWSGVRPYTHHQLTSGLTVDGNIIGSAMGPLAAGTTAGVDWRGSSSRLSLSAALERYSGADRYEVQNPASSDIVWIRTVDRPDENRVRVVADWRADPGPNRFAPSIRLGYEHVTRWTFTAAARSNVLASVKIEYRP